jgi:hypothetical protein
VNIFEVIRENVTARECAERYGFDFRRGRINCPFHGGANFNLSFKGGGFTCFVCQESGDSISFVSKLFNLTPLEAVKRINTDFRLALPLEKQSKAEMKRQREKTQKREGLKNYISEFEKWVDGAYKTFAELNNLHRAETYRQWDAQKISEFLSLHSLSEYLFDVLFDECRTVEKQAMFFRNYHKSVEKMQKFFTKRKNRPASGLITDA